MPTSNEIRAALDRVIASDMLQHSPQLIAFLRFIVQATLRGEGDRIKGYTIGIEALGRGEDFDPQSDPIVRVEAGRLRRALEHYYAGPGAADVVVIDIPRGRYVPTFRRRLGQPVPLSSGVCRGLLAAIRRAWGMSLAALAFVLIGTTVLVAIGRWDREAPSTAVTDQQLMNAFRTGNGFPIVSVEPFEAVGTPAASKITFDGLRRKLTDALAHFDEITVAPANTTFAAAGAGGPSGNKYQLRTTAEYRNDSTASLTFRLVDTGDDKLVDTGDDRVLWVQTFNLTQAEDERVVREVATTLARAFGVIHSRERGRLDHDPRYACVLTMLDYLRGLDAGVYAQARACLERVTRLDPNFAIGFAWLSVIYIREHQYEGFDHPGVSPTLDRALKAARRAVALKPQSARAHEALLGAYFAGGEFAAAFAEGDTALSLNPFDPATRTVYGIRLIAVGQYDRGAALLKDASTNTVQRPTWLDSYLFFAAYLKGDFTTASQYANLDTSETHPLNLLARAILAARNGDQGRAREAMDRLNSLYPKWRDSPRRELRKFFPSTEIMDLLARDLLVADLV